MPQLPAEGLAYFPGILQVMSWEVTMAHGTSPSSFSMVIIPQAELPEPVGNFTVVYGDVVLTFEDCKLDSTSFEFTESGFLWRLSIFDRRWKWIFGKMLGDYNIRTQHNVIWDITERTPQDLAILCLDELGEEDYDVSDMPNDVRPEISWQGIAPAQALQELTDTLRCRIVLQLDGTVGIRIEGQGERLPQNNRVMYYSPVVDIPEAPDTVEVLCGPTRYQADLQLEAVGIDADGSIKPIDELLYIPEGGWSASDPPHFNCLPDADENLPDGTVVNGTACRDKARESVFRYYRVCGISTPDNDGFQRFDQKGGAVLAIKGAINTEITDLRQILPLENEQVDRQLSETDDLGENQYVNRPAWVFGVWFDDRINDIVTPQGQQPPPPTAPVPPVGPSDPQIYNSQIIYNSSVTQKTFSIQADKGIVVFSEPIYGKDPDGDIRQPAQLVLRTAFSIRYFFTSDYNRHVRSRDTGFAFDTQPMVLKHDEIVRSLAVYYSGNGYLGGFIGYDTTVEPTPDAANTNTECDYYIDAAVNDFQIDTPEVATYIGIVLVELDGAIQQIVISGGPQGCTTQIHRNNETHPHIVPYQERTFLRKQSDIEVQKNKIRQGIKQHHTLDFRPP